MSVALGRRASQIRQERSSALWRRVFSSTNTRLKVTQGDSSSGPSPRSPQGHGVRRSSRRACRMAPDAAPERPCQSGHGVLVSNRRGVAAVCAGKLRELSCQQFIGAVCGGDCGRSRDHERAQHEAVNHG